MVVLFYLRRVVVLVVSLDLVVSVVLAVPAFLVISVVLLVVAVVLSVVVVFSAFLLFPWARSCSFSFSVLGGVGSLSTFALKSRKGH